MFLKSHKLRAWSPLQQCSEMELLEVNGIMRALTLSKDQSTKKFIANWIIGR